MVADVRVKRKDPVTGKTLLPVRKKIALFPPGRIIHIARGKPAGG